MGNYFYHQIQRWEPLIEPWNYQFKISTLNGKNQSVGLVSNEKLNINITVPFVDILLRALKSWSEDYYGLPENQLEQAPDVTNTNITSPQSKTALVRSEYYIRNDTGQTLWYWLDSKGADNIIELPQGKEEPLHLPNSVVAQNQRVLLFLYYYSQF